MFRIEKVRYILVDILLRLMLIQVLLFYRYLGIYIIAKKTKIFVKNKYVIGHFAVNFFITVCEILNGYS